MDVRPVTASDLPRLHELNEACVPEVGSVPAREWAALASLTTIALLAEHPTAGIVGFCFVMAPGEAYGSVNYRWFMDRYDDAYYLDRVAVDADHRGSGIGGALYDAVTARILDEAPHIRRLTLEVNVDPPNPVSLAFHARRGFREVGRQVTPYGFEVSLQEKVLQ